MRPLFESSKCLLLLLEPALCFDAKELCRDARWGGFGEDPMQVN